MQLGKYRNQSVAVFGLGKTGLSVINTLVNCGAKIYAWDDNNDQVTNAKVIYKECSFIHPKEFNWYEIKMLILSPGIPISYPTSHWIIKFARDFNCEIKSDIELFLEDRTKDQKIIGVTGTNGKSTTTSLIGHILKSAGKKVAIGGNLGIPVLNLNRDAEIYVIEFSSFQLELINKINLDIAVLLNITPDHIDRHGTMQNYITIKSKLIIGSKVAAIGCDSEITVDIFNKFAGNKIPILSSMLFQLPFLSFQYLDTKMQLELRSHMSDIKINLMSNAENIVAACVVCKLLGVDSKVVIDGIKSFSGLKHRNELLGKIANVFFVNDSKATNAKSSEKAILSYKNIYWVVGGKSKESGSIESLKRHFVNIKKAFLIGESAEIFANIMEGKIDFVKCCNLASAFKLAFKEAINSKEE
ncbi:MAG: UDP-N-acetylmuramoyl-L-alanine--D-glutamate ligase, partial [Wolbachia pipientis]|nr:UDP-N-acetylmuramoyl-L-alanine--D-glutamate ligase [Wolbachia pipientis]